MRSRVRSLLSRGLPRLVDAGTGARLRYGVRYPMRGGGVFEIIRADLNWPARVLIRIETPWASLHHTRAKPWRALGAHRLAVSLGHAPGLYRWIDVDRLYPNRAVVSFPPIDLRRIVR